VLNRLFGVKFWCYGKIKWLIELVCVAAGRFEDDFVSARLKQLQMWIDRMCKHPVISHSEVFLHFLSCTDDKVFHLVPICMLLILIYII